MGSIATTRGTIRGHAVDRAGAVSQGALVELQPQGMSIATNAHGEFTVPDLAPGEYTAKVSYVGFKAFTTKVQVKAGADAKVDAILEVAAGNEARARYRIVVFSGHVHKLRAP